MKSKTTTTPIHTPNRHAGLAVVLKKLSAFGASALALCALLLGASVARAEQVATLNYVSATNIFAGAYFNGYATSNNQVRVVITDNSNQPVNISFSAPAGITAMLNAPFDTNGFTSNTTFSFTVLVNGLAQGTYPLTITATNPAVANSSTNLTINLIADHLWVAANTNDVNWSTATNWSSNSVPGVGDTAIFGDTGALVIWTNATSTNGYYTNYISSSTTVDGLVYVTTTNSNAKPINTTLASGTTLSVLGRRGLIANVDCRNDDSKTLTVNIWGTGASLLVSNANGNIAASSVSGGNNGLIFDMSGLDNFTSVGQRFGVGDGQLVQAGGLSTSGNQAQLIRNFAFARTNLVKVSYVGPISGYDYMTNSIMFFNNFDGNNGSQQIANLGITNAFFADSIAIALNKAGGNLNLLRFNPAFISNNPAAYFRGTTGGRMSFLGVGIDCSLVNSTARTRGHLDLSGGTVDLQVNTVWLGHNRTNFSGGNQMIGNVTMTRGIIDANTIIAGYKEFVNTNTCQSTINILGTNSTLVVNTELMLGYTAGDTAPDDVAFTPTTFGRLNVRSNAVARVNRISVGRWSTNNQIQVDTGATLIITNTIATATNKLTALNMAGGNLTLRLNGLSTNVYVTNLTAALGKVNIASITGLGTYPTNVPLISYETLISAPEAGTMPPGLFGTISNNVASKTINMYIENTPPQSLIWRGNLSGGVWDGAIKNWVNTNGATTNFQFGDFTRFDDTGLNSTVTLSGSLTPAEMIVSNTAVNYTMTGSGTVVGASALQKQSTGSLTLDTTFGSILTVSGGTVIVTPNGFVNSATVQSGGSLTNGGTITTSLINAGGTTVNTNTVNGSLSVQSGTVVNSGTISGNLGLSLGATLTNLSGASLTTTAGFNPATNSTLANLGTLNLGAALSVGGRLTGNGTITRTVAIGSAPVNIGNGGNLDVGPNLGTMTMDGIALKLDAGSTNTFKVYLNLGTNDVVACDRLDFGNNTECIIVVNNAGTGSFAAGQSFELFRIYDQSGPLNAARTNVTVKPNVPGLGMAWDTSILLTNGILSIVSAPIPTPTNIVYSVSGGVSHLSWPVDYIGWRLQTQTNAITVGIKTNWVDVAGADATNSVYITNSPGVGVQFFRMIFP